MIRPKSLLVAQGVFLLGLAVLLGIVRPTSARLMAALPNFCGTLAPPNDGLPELPTSDLFTLMDALGSALTARQQNAAFPQLTATVCVARVWGRGEWALIALRAVDARGAGQDELALAYRANGTWAIAFPETLYYIEWLNVIPRDLLPQMMKAVTVHPAAPTDPSQGEYTLPYLAGTSALTVRAGVDHDNAIDFSMPTGTPVLAARSGRIEQIVQENDLCGCNPLFALYNNYIVIDHGDGEKSYYLHIATNSVPPSLREGSFVERGMLIALSGAVGYTCSLVGEGCGPHLHFEVRREDARIRPRFVETAADLLSWQVYTSTNTLALRSLVAPYGRPVTGDFNGDGRADLAVFMEASNTWYVAASAGDGLSTYRGWLGGLPLSPDSSPERPAWLAGDFDGDGRTDVGLFYARSGTAFVARSTGQGFTAYMLWLFDPSAERANPPLVGDFNGDRRADLALPQPDSTWAIATSTGTHFDLFGFSPLMVEGKEEKLGAGRRWFAADMDADGRADLVAYSAESGDWEVALSQGTRFAPPTRWITRFGNGSSAQLVGDFNGDGRADAATFAGYYGDWWVALSDGRRLLPPTQWLTRLGVGMSDQFAADFNGDGRTDAAAFQAQTGVLDVAISNGWVFRFPARWLYGYLAPAVASQD